MLPLGVRDIPTLIFASAEFARPRLLKPEAERVPRPIGPVGVPSATGIHSTACGPDAESAIPTILPFASTPLARELESPLSEFWRSTTLAALPLQSSACSELVEGPLPAPTCCLPDVPTAKEEVN